MCGLQSDLWVRWRARLVPPLWALRHVFHPEFALSLSFSQLLKNFFACYLVSAANLAQFPRSGGLSLSPGRLIKLRKPFPRHVQQHIWPQSLVAPANRTKAWPDSERHFSLLFSPTWTDRFTVYVITDMTSIFFKMQFVDKCFVFAKIGLSTRRKQNILFTMSLFKSFKTLFLLLLTSLLKWRNHFSYLRHSGTYAFLAVHQKNISVPYELGPHICAFDYTDL